MPRTPEQEARAKIDVQLADCGWLVQDSSQKEQNGFVFTAEQRACLGLIRDHVATILSIEPEDFNYAPFSHRGGLGKAHQVFGAELPRHLDQLNEALAA